MRFKAKLSPKQFFAYRGSKQSAVDGYYVTDDPEIIKILEKNPYWIAEKGKGDIKEPKESKDVKKKEKKND